MPFNLSASDTAPSKEFKNYISANKNYTNTLTQKFSDVFKYIYPDCDQDIQFQRLNPRILLQPYFTPIESVEMKGDFSNLTPHIGQWIETTTVNSCGKSLRLNLLTTAYSENKPPILHPLINGKTKIEPLNQSLAENSVSKSLTEARNCRTSKTVINTSFLGYRSSDKNKLMPDNENLGWFERWTVNACNKIETVNLAILPDPRTKHRYVAKVK